MFGLKTFLKVLSLPLILITLTGLFTEIVNVNVSSVLLREVIVKTLNLSADYFNQETYKSDTENSGDVASILGENGEEISGQFYIGTSDEEIYNTLYRDSYEFGRFVEDHKGIWKDLEAVLTPGINELIDDNLVTPLNMGITYLDTKTVERIFKWQLGSILIGGREGLIQTDKNGSTYVEFHGFRVYVNDAVISPITYEVVPVDSPRFRSITNMDYSNLGLEGAEEERMNILVASIDYSIPLAYEGVTFLSSIIETMWSSTLKNDNSSVDGLDGYSTYNDSNGRGLNLTPVEMTGGGIDGDTELATTGSITYYVIR